MKKELLWTRLRVVLLVGLTAYCFFMILSQSRVEINQHFTQLSESFLQGKTYFIHGTMNGWLDTVLFQDKHYWPLGPFPSILLIPFVALFSFSHIFFFQGYLNAVLGFEIFVLIFSMARKQGFSKQESVIWALSFCFGSMLFGVLFIPWSYFFAHTVAVFLLCLFLWEYYYGRRNWIRLGLYAGALLATRIPAGIGAFTWLAIESVQFSSSPAKWIKRNRLGWLIGFVAVVGLLGWYNFIRFGNPLESGYNWQILYTPAHIKARSYGTFSIRHIPGNIFASLLSSPTLVYEDAESSVLRFPFIKSNPWGMSVLFTSPYLLFLLLSLTKKMSYYRMLVPVVAGLAIIFTYYGIGYYQYGYRYFLDVFPWLFLLLMQSTWVKWKRMPSALIFLCLLAVTINVYLLTTLAVG